MDWNMVPQFFAIQTLHRLIREDGESAERLAALAESYARRSATIISAPGRPPARPSCPQLCKIDGGKHAADSPLPGLAQPLRP